MKPIACAMTFVLVAACGGSESQETSTTAAGAATSTTGTSESPQASTSTTAAASDSTTIADDGFSSPDPSDLEPETGIVTLRDTTYTFDLSGRCQVQDGAMAASGPLADGSPGSVEAIFPTPEMQAEFGAPQVLVVFGDASANDTWIAQEGYEPAFGDPPTPEQSSVTQLDVVGSVATGTAVFWETASGRTRDGTFAFRCE